MPKRKSKEIKPGEPLETLRELVELREHKSLVVLTREDLLRVVDQALEAKRWANRVRLLEARATAAKCVLDGTMLQETIGHLLPG